MRTWHLPHLLLLLWATFAQADPGKLEYLSEISPPFNFSDQQGMPTGLSVELMQLIWKARGLSPQPIRILPWARGYNLLQQKTNVVLFATARTPQREAIFKWACPIDHSEFVLLGRKADNITLASEAEISRYKVGVVRSTVSKQLLLERGIDERQLMLANRLTQAAKCSPQVAPISLRPTSWRAIKPCNNWASSRMTFMSPSCWMPDRSATPSAVRCPTVRSPSFSRR